MPTIWFVYEAVRVCTEAFVPSIPLGARASNFQCRTAMGTVSGLDSHPKLGKTVRSYVAVERKSVDVVGAWHRGISDAAHRHIARR